MKKRKKKSKQQEQSMIGMIVDMSLEDFKKEVKRQRINVGTLNNLILNLEGAYYELRIRKEGVVSLVTEGKRKKEDPEIKKALQGLYAEMTKLEQKIVYLKDLVKDLMNVD